MTLYFGREGEGLPSLSLYGCSADGPIVAEAYSTRFPVEAGVLLEFEPDPHAAGQFQLKALGRAIEVPSIPFGTLRLERFEARIL